MKLNITSLRILAYLWQNPSPPPFFEDLAAICGCHHRQNIADRLERLQRLGLIEKEYRKKRTLRATCRFIPAEELPDFS